MEKLVYLVRERASRDGADLRLNHAERHEL